MRTSEELIAFLNKKRKPDSTAAAYLSDQSIHPDYEYLRQLRRHA